MRRGLSLLVFGLGMAGGAEGLRRSGERGHDPRWRRWATGYRAFGLALVLGGGILEIVDLVVG